MGDALSSLTSGVLVMGYLIVGLFFLRFWHESRDRLFGIIALRSLKVQNLQDGSVMQVASHVSAPSTWPE